MASSGGLDADRNWHQKKDGFFLPGKAMARLFKGKFLSGVKKLHDAAVYRNQYEYQELLDTCYDKNWIAISNSRILRMDETTVTIRLKDYKCGGEWKELTLGGIEFIRRFLMHVR